MAELTVLGSCGAWPEANRACAGFLLEHDGYRVVLDLGYGTLPRLLERLPAANLDAVIVTHAHPDHCVDVSALARVRQYTAADSPKLPLHCAPGVLEVLEALEPRPHPSTIFEFHGLDGTRDLGPFRLETFELPHYVPNFGVRLSAPGLTVAYTGDSGPSPVLAGLGAGADLFVMDATLQGPSPESGPRYVMTATEAAHWATRAGAKRLLLTHFWPGSDRSVSVREASAAFDGEIIAAEEGLTLKL
ncbi:MBL fold metallo-hydrolase [Amycolatopsis sp. cg5]|uniref:MBL fold metallo-hydrolase n=1 Tax=Amycolatopsis sp. cg5 TaxID=3238802 RepID=UPI0035242E5F